MKKLFILSLVIIQYATIHAGVSKTRFELLKEKLEEITNRPEFEQLFERHSNDTVLEFPDLNSPTTAETVTEEKVSVTTENSNSPENNDKPSDVSTEIATQVNDMVTQEQTVVEPAQESQGIEKEKIEEPVSVVIEGKEVVVIPAVIETTTADTTDSSPCSSCMSHYKYVPYSVGALFVVGGVVYYYKQPVIDYVSTVKKKIVSYFCRS